MMIVEDERISNNIPEKRGIKFDEGLKGKKVVGSLKELLSHFRRCSEPSQIGTITNYNTTWNDMTKNGFGNYTPRCYALGFLQGWDIDKPKTGASVNIPEKFKTELKPHWLYLAKLFKMDSKKFIECGGIIKDIPETVYHSNSPLGKLCDYVLEKGRILLTHHSDTVNFTGALATTVDVNEVTNVYSTVEYLEKKDREELVDILAKYPERTTEDTMKIKQAMEELTSKYSLLLRSLPADNTSIAVACYKLCYGRNNQHNSNSKSFVWNCMFDEILECISKLSNGRKLIKLPVIDDDDIEEVFINSKGVMFYGDTITRNVNIDKGTYKVINLGEEDEKYIYVKRVNKVQQYVENVVEEEDKIYSIDVAGYARQNLTGIDVYKILEEKEFTIKLIDNIFNIIVDNKIVTGVRASSVLGIVNLNNKVLKAVEVQNPIFEPKRINDDTVWYDREENKAIRKSLNVKFKVIGECEDTNEEYYSKKGCTSDVEEFINEVPQTLEDCTTTAHKYTAEEVFGVSSDITNPFGCEYDIEITSKSYKELLNGDLLGSVTLYKNGNSYLYEVIFSNNGLVVQSSVNFSTTASTWIKSLVAVEFVMYM